jgi:hypothetical protein
MKPKSKTIELDVDFIGGQGSPMTAAEEKALSEYIKRQKSISKKLVKTQDVKTRKHRKAA